MKKNILKKFSEAYKDAPAMWESLSGEHNAIKERDPEMFDAFLSLGETINQFAQANELMNSPDGLTMKQALEILEKKKKKEPEEDYGFLVFVLVKNLQHSGLIKILSRPERIVKKALSDHAKKRITKK